MTAPFVPAGAPEPLALNAAANAQMARLLDALLVLQAQGSAPVSELAARVGLEPQRLRALLSTWMVAPADAVGPDAPFSIVFGDEHEALGTEEEADGDQAGSDVVHLVRRPGDDLLDDVALRAVSVEDVTRGLLTARALLQDDALEGRPRDLVKGLVATLEQALSLTTTSPLTAVADELRQAVRTRSLVRFRYRDPWRGDESRPSVEPYDVRRSRDRLVLDAGGTPGLPYRTYDLSSVSDLEVGAPGSFSAPELPPRERRDVPVEVVLRVPAGSAAERRLEVGWGGRLTGPAHDGTVDVRVELDRADAARLGVLLLQLGPPCTVVSPASLSDVAVPVAQRLLEGLA